MAIVARFEIERRQLLDEHGAALAPLPPFATTDALVSLYRWMTLIRAYDAKAVALQRTGQLGTYAPHLGQEAVNAAIGSALQPDDVLLPTYRENGAQLMRGVAMRELFLYWAGDERGSNTSGARGDFPICVTIAAQCTHAVGAAYAIRLRQQPRAVLCALGDGATSKGDFYEGLNAAGVWKLPLVFVVSNNQWAISVPRAHQSVAETLAQKAIAAGVPGLQVDGNDVIALRQVLDEALARARAGDGPTLIEALTYRLSDHTTADDASRYRTAEDVTAAWQREPLARLRAYLVQAGAWDKTREEVLLKECNEAVQTVVEAFLATAPPQPAQMFDYHYAAWPAPLARQRIEALGEG